MSTHTLAKRGTKRNRRPKTAITADHSKGRESGDLRSRAKELLDQEIDFIANREFARRDAKSRILHSADSTPSESAGTRLPKDLPAHLARLCEAKLLTAEQERNLFRKMNYLRVRANVLRSRLDPGTPDAGAIAAIEEALAEASEVRDRIIKANMRLVISIVKKFVTPKHSFDELLSDGIISLMHAVDKFDYDKGFRFSTYAYRAIARNAYRTISDRQREDARFDPVISGELSSIPEEDRTSALDEKEWISMRTTMLQMMERLDRRERFILRGRFALGGHRKVRTFQCLADKLGISKERVRQLEQRAIVKLKAIVEGAQAEGQSIAAVAG
ncbi:MAG: sigma-70 family RNA polymerase sigma factor [Planctomycetes bacterium]|nr:sigma-70 family RNA polymerase sigma factor [Planctomycetota bacterium]